MGKKHSTIKSFSYAGSGLKVAFKNEPNFRVHLISTAVVTSAAYLLHFSRIEWLILITTIMFVIILELVNTAVEAVVDLVSPKIRAKAKIAKDVSAGAVLVVSIFASIIGLILFVPKILHYLK